MNYYIVRLYDKLRCVMANSPRQAVKLAVDDRSIPSSAWRWLGDATTEGFYGPLQITMLPRKAAGPKQLELEF